MTPQESSQAMDVRAVDESSWDGNRAMSECQSAEDYNKICAGKKAGDPALRSSHALPHHYLSKAPTPNAAGVRAALQRFSSTQGLTNSSEARSHLEAHMATIQAQSQSSSEGPSLVRAIDPSHYEVRDSEGASPVLAGHMAVFNQWTEIDSIFEGTFLERIAPGAFTKTFEENRDQIKVTLNHGKDPELGDRPLGIPSRLEEEADGAAYDVPLFEGIPPLVMSGLRAGAYGSSFRFRVTHDEMDNDAEVSDHNPKGLPERTILGVDLHEFGPVTFPAYVGATAGVRSLTDEFIMSHLTQGEGLQRFAEYVESLKKGVEEKPPEEKPRHQARPAAREPLFTGNRREETPAWLL